MPYGLNVFGVVVEVGVSCQVPELVWRHMDTDIVLDDLNDLIGEGVLVLPVARLRDEEIAVGIGIEAREDVTPVPAQPASDIVGDLGVIIMFSRLHLRLRNVQQKAALRPIWLGKVSCPAEADEVLWPERDGQLEIDGDRHLGLDEVDAACRQRLGNLGHELVRKEQEFGPQLF